MREPSSLVQQLRSGGAENLLKFRRKSSRKTTEPNEKFQRSNRRTDISVTNKEGLARYHVVTSRLSDHAASAYTLSRKYLTRECLTIFVDGLSGNFRRVFVSHMRVNPRRVGPAGRARAADGFPPKKTDRET